ncbi:MAG: hypothetical protein Q4A71_07620 [Actinomycetaceae bacterium]|nr:hypothetical protein [Actinomycetaceae bacterium]
MNVTAIILAGKDAVNARQVVQAVLNQTVVPQNIALIDATATGELEGYWRQGVQVFRAPGLHSFGAALAHVTVPRAQYYWFLHDDSQPETQCLELLLSEVEKGRTIAATGPTQLDSQGRGVVSAGIHATRWAERVIVSDDLDQGQHDDKSDVLAVGTAGMLVDVQKLDEAGGVDETAGPYAEALELCRRLHLAGHRVTLCAKARIRHEQVGMFQSDFRYRALAARYYNAAVATAFPPVVILWVAGRTVIRVGAAGARGQWGKAADILAAGKDFCAAIPSIMRARRRLRAARISRTAVLKPLELSAQSVRSEKRLQHQICFDESLPKPLDGVAVAELAARRSRTVGALVVLSVFLLAVTMSMGSTFIPAASGGAWADLPGRWADLVEAALTPWNPAGDGGSASINPLLFILSLLSFPFNFRPQLFSSMLFVVAPLLSFWSAWAGITVITHKPALRSAGALAWVGLPVFWIALAQGRLGPLLFHIILPLVFWGFAGALSLMSPSIVNSFSATAGMWQVGRPSRRAAAGGFALAICGAVVPAIVPLAAAVLVCLVRKNGGIIAFISALPALVLVAPALSVTPLGTDAFQRGALWPTLLAAPGLTTWWMVLGAILVACAVLGFFHAYSTIAFAIMLVGLAGALYGSPYFGAGILPCLSLTYFGFIAAAILGALNAPRVVRVAVPMVVLVGAVVAPSLIAVHGVGAIGDAVHARTHRLAPATVSAAIDSGKRSRVLMLDSEDDALVASLWRGPTPLITQGDQGKTDGLANRELRTALVQALAASNETAQILRKHAIETIIMPASVRNSPVGARVAQKLDGVLEITAVNLPELGNVWKVKRALGRVQLAGQTVPSRLIGVKTQIQPGPQRQIILAERASTRWHATLGGTRLESHPRGWQQAFVIPADMGGTLKIAATAWWVWPWRIALVLVLLLMLGIIWPTRKEVISRSCE